MPSKEDALTVLSAIKDPDLGRDVVSLGMIKDVAITDAGKVSFTFELTTPACPVRDRFQSLATELVAGLPGVTGVELKMTANVRAAFNGRAPEAAIPGVNPWRAERLDNGNTLIVDSNSGHHGKQLLGLPIEAPASLSGKDVTVFVSTFVYGAEIRVTLERDFHYEGRIVTI